MLQQFKDKGNDNMVQKLKKAPVSLSEDIPRDYLLLRDKAMHSLRIGTMRNMKSVITGIFFPSLGFREYTLKEKINLWVGKSRSGVSCLLKTMLKTDLSQSVTELQIPVYFFHGIYDYTCCCSVAESYFLKIKAPIKGFYRFEQSAHSPIFEEPGKMQKIIREDVLKGTNKLADLK